MWAVLLLLAGPLGALAHMQLVEPKPLGPGGLKEQYPYNCCDVTNLEPCRGFLKDFQAGAQVQSTATWAAGSQQVWKAGGVAPEGSTHYGGSCQVSLSVDKGQTFRVLTSYEGNCPHRKGGTDPASQTFPFTVPADTPSGQAVFGWAWYNREQEFFHSCAIVTITGGSGQAAPAGPVGGTTAAVGGVSATGGQKAKPNPTAGGVPAAVSEGFPVFSQPVVKGGQKTGLAPTIEPQNEEEPEEESETYANNVTYPTRSRHRQRPGKTDCAGKKGRKTKTRRPYDRRLQPTGAASAGYIDLFEATNHTLVHRQAGSVPFNQRPLMLIANWKQKGKCITPWEKIEAKFPEPGPEVVKGDGQYPLGLPDCSETARYHRPEAN